MMFARFKQLRIGGSEAGIALPIVVGLGMVLILLVSVGTAVSTSGMIRAKNNDDWNAAMSAAYAGVADYEGRVTNDSSYAQYGNPNSPFTIAGGSNTTVRMPPTTNPAFSIAAGGSWANVPLADGSASGASYRYEVDNSKLASTGVLRLRSTGKVGTATRTVVATIKQTGFTNYVYFTDYEMIDPNVLGGCPQDYAWRTPRPSNCLINFIPGDTLDGPVHSNDTINICGGTFLKGVTSSDPGLHAGVRYTQTSCSTNQTPGFANTGDPSYASTIAMPPPTQQINQTRTDTPTTVPMPGCLYTGPTSIVFNSNGTMTVRSPWTKATQISGSPATSGTAPSWCGTPGNPTKSATANAGTLAGTAGQTLSIGASTQLYNNLDYVQSVPAAPTDPNYSPTSNYCPASISCVTTNIGSKSKPNNVTTCTGADGSTTGNGIGYPIVGEVAPRSDSYSCTNGDVFVQGTMHGALTINADHYVYVTGNLTYQDPAHDILGLVGAGSVYVWNPVNSSGQNLVSWDTRAACARSINAAILSNLHSFAVQNYNRGGNDGNLCVTGSIAQEYRGPVGTGGGGGGMTGFTKKYSYDTRLLYTPPPKFPTPKTTSYDVATEVEVKGAFNADGSPAS
ncbi:MAG TPA: hypothetical protein VIJ18_00905 [Microbacteriaceae bacterium]